MSQRLRVQKLCALNPSTLRFHPNDLSPPDTTITAIFSAALHLPKWCEFHKHGGYLLYPMNAPTKVLVGKWSFRYSRLFCGSTLRFVEEPIDAAEWALVKNGKLMGCINGGKCLATSLSKVLLQTRPWVNTNVLIPRCFCANNTNRSFCYDRVYDNWFMRWQKPSDGEAFTIHF